MNVILVTHEISKYDGQGRVNLEVIRAALQAGHTVTLLASRLESADLANHWGEKFRFVRFSESRIPARLFKYQVFAIRTALWLWRYRKASDVVLVNGFITWARGDINAVHFVHDGYYRSGHFPYRFGRSLYDSYQSLFTTLNMKLERRAFRRAQVLVAVSGKVAEELRAIGVPSERVIQIVNGVDVNEFRPRLADERERDHFGLPEDAFLILFAGDLRSSRKNVDTVLRALVKASPQSFLVIAGDEKGSSCVARTKELRIDGRVRFLGKTTEMPRLMRAVDAFVFPSCYDPCPLVILEAMSSGLSVVTTRSTGTAGLVEAGGGFVLDDPLDDAQLARIISRLANDDNLKDSGRRARDIALSHSWTEVGQHYVSLFEKHNAFNTSALKPNSTSGLS